MKLASLALVLLVGCGLFVLAGCGSAQGAAKGGESGLTVFAAASMTRVLPTLDNSNHYEFSGSNTLEFQIEQGAPADVFLSASPKYIVRLRKHGLVYNRPAWFATNRLVLLVPRSNPAHIRKVADVARPGVRLVLAARGVPAGDYARKALAAMHLEPALKNVVSDEPDVEGVVAKIALGEADAGFVYATDAAAVASKVKSIPLPPAGRQTADYGAAVVKGSKHLLDARAFVELLLSPPGQAVLEKAGFGPAPKSAR